MKARNVLVLTCALILTIGFGLLFSSASADPIIPPVWDVVFDDFESGSLDGWEQVTPENLTIIPGFGRFGSQAFSVAVGQQCVEGTGVK